MAEGYPTIIKIILPKYLGFTSNNNFTSNYTINNSQLDKATMATTDDDRNLEITFPRGVTYADIIEFNFTLTVDPNELKELGSADETLLLASLLICNQSIIDDFPSEGNELRLCGEITTGPVTVSALQCYNSLTFQHECQIQASTVIDENHKAFHVVGEEGNCRCKQNTS